MSPWWSASVVSAIAHRGGSKLRPENTAAAFDHAATLGVDGFECDVHVSRDGEPVVIHDPTLDRTTDATGPVNSFTARELAEIDAGHRFGADRGFPFRGKAGGVPRLRDLLMRQPTLPWIVEIKGDRPEHVAPVLEAIRAAGAMDRVVIGGFSEAVLTEVRRRAALPTSASRPEVEQAMARARDGRPIVSTGYQLFQIPIRLEGQRTLFRPFVEAARAAGLPVQSWIVDEPEDMLELLSWGVTGIISDRPDLAREITGAHAHVG